MFSKNKYFNQKHCSLVIFLAMEEQTDKGMYIFLDVFRRADKNDDGALSWEEFKSFFADGVLSEEELRNLFNDIDTHNTNNLDTGELCEYFAKHLGAFKEMFASLEDMNSCVSKTLRASSEKYGTASLVEQFVSRFLLRETLNQLGAVQRPLEAASDVLEQQAQKERVGIAALSISADACPLHETDTLAEDNKSPPVGVLPGRYGRRARRQFSSQTSWTSEGGVGGGNLGQQVDRLRGLVDRLENKVNISGAVDEEIVESSKEHLMLVAHKKFMVTEGGEKGFRSSLRSYIEAANEADGCLHVNVRCYSGSNYFGMYEIWDTQEDYKSFACSAACKSFRHANIDSLDVPEQLNTILLPKSWWNTE